MSELRIPEGMRKAAFNAWVGEVLIPVGNINNSLEAALRWQKENPPRPDDALKLMSRARVAHNLPGEVLVSYEEFAVEWVRCMYDAPEPVIPPEIDDLLVRPHGSFICESQLKDVQADCTRQNERVIEAFRRGQKAAR